MCNRFKGNINKIGWWFKHHPISTQTKVFVLYKLLNSGIHNRRFLFSLFIVAIVLFVNNGCDYQKITDYKENIPPETSIFISSKDTLNYTKSVQKISWDGRDPDGFVTGFYYTWKETPVNTDWIFTTEHSYVFPLEITRTDTIYLFQVKAVDNTALWDYEVPTKSDVDNEYFSDVGIELLILDSLDLVLSEGDNSGVQSIMGSSLALLTGKELLSLPPTDTLGAVDPTPAKQYFPIKNSPPEIRWTMVSRVPDTTFTVTTFIWTASDLDGDSTIVRFEYALDDTTNWHTGPGYMRNLTLNADSGLTEGSHSFYIRAVDIAGSKSETIRMPEDTLSFWYAKKPKSRYLLIDDHISESATFGFPDAYYKSMLNTVIPESGDYDYWNIEEIFPLSVIQFKETLKLFDRVIWYTDLVKADDEHFIAAQIAIPEFLENGGKIIFIAQFNTGFGSQGEPLAFSPVDSLGKYYDRMLPGSVFNPQSDFQEIFPDAPYLLPELKVSNIIFGVISTAPKEGSVNLYEYADPGTESNPLFVLLGRNDNTGVYDFVFSGAPLHQLNGNDNLNEFFNIILNYVFE